MSIQTQPSDADATHVANQYDYFAKLPRCPDCRVILGDHTRLETDRTKRECPHCRGIFAAHEVFRA